MVSIFERSTVVARVRSLEGADRMSGFPMKIIFAEFVLRPVRYFQFR